MEHLNTKLAELTQEVKTTNTRLMDLTSQLAVNTHILNEHHKRSTMLEDMVRPLQADLAWRSKLWSLVMGSSGLIALISLMIAVIAVVRR